jgi:hypothetical protein
MWQGSEQYTEIDLQEMEKEKRDKEAFAVALIHWPKDPLKAALSVEPHNSGRAVWLAHAWIADPYVVSHQAKLLTDVSQLLPTKVQLTHEAMKVVHDEYATWDVKLKALRFCSDIQGWTGPGSNSQSVTNAQVGSTNKVMHVPMTVDKNTWEAIAEKQQGTLTTSYQYVEE